MNAIKQDTLQKQIIRLDAVGYLAKCRKESTAEYVGR